MSSYKSIFKDDAWSQILSEKSKKIEDSSSLSSTKETKKYSAFYHKESHPRQESF